MNQLEKIKQDLLSGERTDSEQALQESSEILENLKKRFNKISVPSKPSNRMAIFVSRRMGMTTWLNSERLYNEIKFICQNYG